MNYELVMRKEEKDTNVEKSYKCLKEEPVKPTGIRIVLIKMTVIDNT